MPPSIPVRVYERLVCAFVAWRVRRRRAAPSPEDLPENARVDIGLPPRKIRPQRLPLWLRDDVGLPRAEQEKHWWEYR